MKSYHDIVGDGGSDVAGQAAEQAALMRARLRGVRHVVAVMSGKGGVGKSTVTVLLASALAQRGHAVGILDADLNGPSIAKMMGVREQAVRTAADGVEPAAGALGIRVMSMDLLLPDDEAPLLWDAPTQHAAYAWRGLMEAAALREFVADTAWGDLDVLLVDLPPGADRLPTLVDVLPRLNGSVVVTLPTAVSGLVVGRSLRMATEVLQSPIVGLVENMAGYVCGACGTEQPLFPPGRTEALAAAFDVPFLGGIPFDPALAAAADAGELYLQHHAEGLVADAVQSVLDGLDAFLTEAPATNMRV